MNTTIGDIGKAVFAGILIAGLGQLLAGFTAAIAMPSGLIAEGASGLSLKLPLFFWDMLVVQLLGFGLLAAVATALAVKFTRIPWYWICVLVLLCDLILVLGPVMTQLPGFFSWENWWRQSHIIVMANAVLLAGFYADRIREDG